MEGASKTQAEGLMTTDAGTVGGENSTQMPLGTLDIPHKASSHELEMAGKAAWRAVKNKMLASEFISHRRDAHFPHVSDENHGKLSWRIKLSYCSPTLSTLSLQLLLSVYGIQFYEKLGADLSYVSFFIALARSFDVISDPAMSYITDSTRTKWGRRRPFCFTGCIPYAALLILLLSPPSLSPTPLSLWFGFFYVLFFLANTYTNIPYDALGPELTDNYDDRSSLFFVSGLFDGLGSLTAVIVPVLLSLVFSMMISCPEALDSCYSTSGVGQACSPAFGASEPDTYLLGNYTLDTYTENSCALRTLPTSAELDGASCMPGLDCLCKCIEDCQSTCSINNERSAYQIIGFCFGLWYIVTMFNCVYQVKERSQMDTVHKAGNKIEPLPAPAPLVPSILNTLWNKPFTLLLPAWMCDAVVNSIIASMMTYFVRYVIQPEFQEGCNDGIKVKGTPSDSWTCDSQYVLGAAVTCLLVMAFLSTPLWLFINKKLGKRNTWLLWSFVMAVTNGIFIFLGKGDVYMAIAMAGVNGMPLGAKFISDAILADIIDYDEFLTGSRNEATYTMFKSFLPKICAIPAAAIPISLLNVVGHVQPVKGRIQEQPETVAIYLQVVVIIIPTLLSLLGFYFKTKFPLKTKEQVHMISEGIGRHLTGVAAADPVSGEMYLLDKYTAKELSDAHRLNHLRSIHDLELLIKDPKSGADVIVGRIKKHIGIAVGSMGVTLVLCFVTFDLITSETFSFVPVLSIIGFGISLTGLLFALLRFSGLKSLIDSPADPEVVQKVWQHRRSIINTWKGLRRKEQESHSHKGAGVANSALQHASPTAEKRPSVGAANGADVRQPTAP